MDVSQRAPDAADERLGVTAALVRGTGLVQHLLQSVSAEMGLTPQQSQLLCVVEHAPQAMRPLSGMLRIGKSSLTGLVDRAHAAGLIERLADPRDGRSWLVDLTPAGRTAAGEFRRVVTERIERLLAGLTAEESAALDSALSKLVLANQFPDTWPED